MENSLPALLSERLPKLSKGHKKIAEYILSHYDKAAFMTASKLGNIVGVSESTVVRFATELGFEGYPEMQKALKEFTSNKLTTVQRMNVMNDQLAGEDVLSRVLNFDIEQIRKTRSTRKSSTPPLTLSFRQRTSTLSAHAPHRFWHVSSFSTSTSCSIMSR